MEPANLLPYLSKRQTRGFFSYSLRPDKFIFPFLCSFWKESIKTFK